MVFIKVAPALTRDDKGLSLESLSGTDAGLCSRLLLHCSRYWSNKALTPRVKGLYDRQFLGYGINNGLSISRALAISPSLSLWIALPRSLSIALSLSLSLYRARALSLDTKGSLEQVSLPL